ncbi:MAG: MFS transporter, partial [bacterium]|nr:MFS transporter [bacterium]
MAALIFFIQKLYFILSSAKVRKNQHAHTLLTLRKRKEYALSANKQSLAYTDDRNDWIITLYVVAGTGCFFIDNLNTLLVMRALLGVSVGLIMPLSTGLLSYFYPPEEQARLMGLSAAMNQMGGVVGTLLAGVLASIEWNYAFLVYVFGLVALFMILRFLPN